MKNSLIELSHKVENSTPTYVIKHDLGCNWSLYPKTLLRLLFNQTFARQVKISIYDTTLMFQFTE